MLYTHYLINTSNTAPYRELKSNLTDEALKNFIAKHYSHFNENDDYSKEQLQIHTSAKEMTIGCIFQHYLRERKNYFYYSHVYCADMSEREKMLEQLPNIISTAEFSGIPKSDPDLSATAIPYREGSDIVTITYEPAVLKQLVQASIEVLLESNKRRLFIISGWEDCFDIKARDLMSQITAMLPYQCRRRLNFYSYANDISDHEDAHCIVFCRPQDAVNFQRKYGESSYFFFLQQNLAFPKIDLHPFAEFALENYENIRDLLLYADRKLTGKLKNDPEFYDVLCHFMYVDKDESLENYGKHRKWLIPNLSQLYQLGVTSRKKALQMLQNELHFEPDDANVPFESKLSAFLYSYETGMVSKELMAEFLLHIRSCTDPIKWQLLCKQLEIEMDLPDLEPLPELTEKVENAPDITEEEEAEEDAAQILYQPDSFDTMSDIEVAPQEENPQPEEPDKEQADEDDGEMPFLSVNIKSSEPEEEDVEDGLDNPFADTMLPPDDLKQFIANLSKASNIVKYINAGCLYYEKPLYQEFYVQRAVAQYLASAVSCCNTEEDLQRVDEVAGQIAEYQVEAMTLIAGEVRRRIAERKENLLHEAEKNAAKAKEQRELQLLSEFDVIFASNDLDALEKIDLVPRCITENLSRARIEDNALRRYRENKSALALLFLCCQYNTEGVVQECSFDDVDVYFHGNIRANEIRYEWLNQIASMPNIEKHKLFVNAICKFAVDHPEVVEEAKLSHDSLYYLLVENGLLKPSTRKYFIFGGVVVAAIAAVTGIGIWLTASGIIK